MTVKKKFIILFISVMVVLLAILLSMEYLRRKQDASLKTAHFESVSQAVTSTIKYIEHALDQVTFDYTYWDEMVDYVNHPDTAWASVNLATILQSFSVHAVWAYNEEKELVYFVTGIYPGANRVLPLPSDVFPLLHKKRLSRFYVKLPEGLFLISAATIHDDSDIGREQEPRGYFFLGRIVDDEFISTIQAIAGTQVSLDKASIKPPEPGRSAIVFTFPFQSYKGEVVAKAVCTKQINNFESIYQYSRIYILAFLLAGTGVVLLIYYLINRWIHKPMDKLLTSLEQQDPGYILPLADRKDEFSRLSKLIMDFYRQKSDLKVKIAEHEADKQQLSESEEKFSKAFIFNPTATIITDLNEGRILNANSSFLKLTGYSIQEVKGYTPEALRLFEQKNVKTLYTDELRNGQAMAEHELELRNKKGEVRNVLYKSEFIHLQGIMSLLTVFVDITELKQAELTMEAAKKMAEESDRMKNALLVNISHDLRTPLTSILGFTELIIGDTQEENIRMLADRIMEASGRMISSLNAIMTLSEIHAGTLRLKKTPYHVSENMEACVAPYREMAFRKMIEFRMSTEKELVADVDEAYFKQMLQLLLDNAVLFTEQGQVSVDVFESSRDGYSYVTIRVSDTGTGITAAKQQELLTEFSRIAEGNANTFSVSSVGLSLACHLACKMGGMLEMESQPGKGSIFSLLFPSRKQQTRHE
ncbi:MAG TPA: CHASE4 domain-containing protein [Bacteroidales bacterium]|nr:CHASE4 domain-containing protein [Bacteroidales bacterium]HSA42741.1 CHASE4 domain-containing protein [Bacteroidales bacterium]